MWALFSGVIKFLPAAGFLLLASLPQDVAAQQAPAAKAPVTIIVDGTESPEALEKLIDRIAADDHPVSIGFAAKPSAASGAHAGKEARSDEVFDLFVRGLGEGWNAIPRAPEYFSSFARWWNSSPESSGLFPYLFKLFAAFGTSGVAGWLVLRLLRSVGPPPPAEPAPLEQKMRPALVHLSKDVVAAMVLIVLASFLAARIFDPLAAEGKLTGQLVHVLPVLAGYIIIGRFLLSPGEPRLRLFMLPRAEHHFRLLVGYAIAGAILLAIFVGLNGEIGSADIAAGIFITGTTLVTIFRVWWFWHARQDIATVILSGTPLGSAPSVPRRAFAVAGPWLLSVSALLLWALGRIAEAVPEGEKWAGATGTTQVLVVLVPILAVGASILARQRLLTGDLEQTPLQVALSTLTVYLSGAAAWLFGLVLLGWTWRYHLVESQSAEGLTVLRNGIDIIALAVAGWAVTSFFNALFNAYSPQARSDAGDGNLALPAAAVQTRLRSVLPILRGFTLGAVIGLTILLILTQLGFGIGPLLAGFGIFGLAISFGSQTLVKDIVSGFFFMVEDAFRVGEYIDTGKLKGTVEKISLRSLQLRHQSGLLHTVPFGTLGSVTNASRDWATIKFSLRLDRTADIEKARKAIKKIGIEMQADPEYGKSFLMPLKMQGVDEIADSAIIIRAKFTAEPPMASSIQRAALKRIYMAFKEAGIEFASNAVTVRSNDQADAVAAIASAQPVAAPAA
ncbi:mechanosensitive ion channel family protein [Rhizobium phaseoli]|uniref:Mechanosensitive ion channel MscS protein n=2 Tax=Rhizobium phaseoli TaxID=396 RepID=A0ABN4QUK3_9HYPH|nr:mechanosensitive ion channel family protein [Rhizobium phaseoli]ANL89131.1 mechanosensitive ion channel MscS protein [Rhizobium phaseoli]ANL95640.1 mechanosensitive ion channel MscS protein [Rhizobium phaseoli]KEC71309.1 potassium efflux system KefA protein [Rhizobium leguminosarum bv. phaseoli CCGM1]PWI51207.1 hypothetical protein B5K03_26790 [Rhizobium phaseoli]